MALSLTGALNAVTGFPWLVRLATRFPRISRIANGFIIHSIASSTVPRPHRFSLWSPTPPPSNANPQMRGGYAPQSAPPHQVSHYTAWPGLVDLDYTGRHLPPRPLDDPRVEPPAAQVVELFRRDGPMKPNPRSNALFCFFAQWFTDSFLRTDPRDPRRTTSNHEIDLCQIYGLDQGTSWALRERKGGLLKSRKVDGQEYPPFLFVDGELDEHFVGTGSEYGLSYLRYDRGAAWKAGMSGMFPASMADPERRDWLYAAGLDRGNSTIVYSAFNTIFLREHNRIARELAKEYGNWDDDRLFETARLINIRQVLNIVINDYIHHIGGSFPFRLDRSFAERKHWYRTNRISIEFNLLYRWHSLVPDHLDLAGRKLRHDEYRFNNALLEKHGVERVLSDAAKQPAGRMGLFNTPDFFFSDKMPAEARALKWARDFRVESFNEYRKRFSLKPYKSIDEFADGEAVARALKSVYGGDMDAVELTVGLLAEKRGANEVMPETLRRMVAYDAFTHILTNPILAQDVHIEATFSPLGWKMIHEEAAIDEIVRRNTATEVFASFAYPQGSADLPAQAPAAGPEPSGRNRPVQTGA